MSKRTSLGADLFVSAEVHEREVTLADDTKRTLYFKEVPAVAFRRFQLAERSDDEDARAGSIAELIAASLCEPDGKPAINSSRAAQLKPAVAAGILNAIFEVNGMLGARPGKASRPGAKSGSGTSSPSHSADAPSTSGNA